MIVNNKLPNKPKYPPKKQHNYVNTIRHLNLSPVSTLPITIMYHFKKEKNSQLRIYRICIDGLG